MCEAEKQWSEGEKYKWELNEKLLFVSSDLKVSYLKLLFTKHGSVNKQQEKRKNAMNTNGNRQLQHN